MEYGYVRVSTTTQNVDRQLDEMFKQGLDEKHNLLVIESKFLMKNKFTLISKVEKILKDLIIKR